MCQCPGSFNPTSVETSSVTSRMVSPGETTYFRLSFGLLTLFQWVLSSRKTHPHPSFTFPGHRPRPSRQPRVWHSVSHRGPCPGPVDLEHQTSLHSRKEDETDPTPTTFCLSPSTSSVSATPCLLSILLEPQRGSLTETGVWTHQSPRS